MTWSIERKVIAGLVGVGLCAFAALLLWPIPQAHQQMSDMQSVGEEEDVKDIPATSTAATETVNEFRFEIKDTPAGRAQGLSGRSDVPQGYGMLFVFPETTTPGFWMKDMYVPIDIIWLSDTGVVVGIEDSVTPESYPNVFYSPQPVRLVLETRAGEARRQRWSVGSQIALPVRFE